MALEELKAHFLTPGAYYHGRLIYSDVPAAARPRLHDFLNGQIKGRVVAGAQKQPVPMLKLEEAEVVVYRGDSKVSLNAQQVSVSVRAVVIGFDESPPKRDSIGPDAAYEKRQALEEDTLVILTRTRHRLVGKVRGGIKRLMIRSIDEPFVALTGVQIEDLSSDARAPASLPFVALNMEYVEAFWKA